MGESWRRILFIKRKQGGLSIITFTFTANYNEEFKSYVDELFTLTKQGKNGLGDRDVRMSVVDDLIESFVTFTGKTPKGGQLDRLSSLILRDELADPHPDKMSREEYPFMSDDQLERREEKEYLISDIQNGRDKVIGHRKTWYEDDNGVMQERRQKIYDYSSKTTY